MISVSVMCQHRTNQVQSVFLQGGGDILDPFGNAFPHPRQQFVLDLPRLTQDAEGLNAYLAHPVE